ncbi:MAG: hypothetical protein LBG63_02140 [Candidatus Methanoplasma sp.]|jgi:hypothetical protein|nr:hypothetical protein [Candidatus Methanoplasma sp.]
MDLITLRSVQKVLEIYVSPQTQSIAVFSLAFFFIVEDPSLSIGTVNKWTPLMGGLFAAVLIPIVLSFRGSRDRDRTLPKPTTNRLKIILP